MSYLSLSKSNSVLSFLSLRNKEKKSNYEREKKKVEVNLISQN